jgi:N-succinyldiaminopimelate aminotransferase
MNSPDTSHPGFKAVPRTGVIFVMTEAAKLGYSAKDPNWVNLGQGAPEIEELDGAPPRLTNIPIEPDDREYAPVDGLLELKQAVANLYNHRFRANKKSKYTAQNVSICSGGRLALTRVVSTLGQTNIGHFLPDYTAYEELLGSFSSFAAIPILLDSKKNYVFSSEEFQREILGRGLSAILLSNPNNPTGKVVSNENLNNYVTICRELGCTLILDEFYSHYVYGLNKLAVSAAEFVDDVDKDPIVIIDGLTKNWRYPGLRVSWTVAPKAVIESLASAGSYLDGGCARPIQRAAAKLIAPDQADLEAAAIQKEFLKKRELLTAGLSKLGIKTKPEIVEGAFYCWGDLSALKEPLNTGMGFFQAALKEQVIVVPGEFFDINPGQRQAERPSRFKRFARFSFGPKVKSLELGLEKLARVIGS